MARSAEDATIQPRSGEKNGRAGKLLEVRDLRAGYGPIDVLHGITLEVRSGEIVCLIGANGAGKTSTLMCISRINAIRGGAILFQGTDITRTPPDQVVRMGLAQVPEGRRIFPRLTVLENLEMGAYLRKDHDGIARDLDAAFELFPILKERLRQLAGSLSGGEQQMCAMARGLMADPEILLLDEPSLGLSPILVERIFGIIRDLNARGRTLILVEQNAAQALKVADRAYVMETGRIVLKGAASELAEVDEVKRAYLGVL